jgi:hypothetical protein
LKGIVREADFSSFGAEGAVGADGVFDTVVCENAQKLIKTKGKNLICIG